MSAMHSDELGPGSNWLNCLLESGKGPEILCGHCDERAAALLCALCVPEVVTFLIFFFLDSDSLDEEEEPFSFFTFNFDDAGTTGGLAATLSDFAAFLVTFFEALTLIPDISTAEEASRGVTGEVFLLNALFLGIMDDPALLSLLPLRLTGFFTPALVSSPNGFLRLLCSDVSLLLML